MHKRKVEKMSGPNNGKPDGNWFDRFERRDPHRKSDRKDEK